jgi:predicted nuclease of restriction endonuclease-like RecB superfamily
MLTGKLVRVRYSRDRIRPCYLDPAESGWHGAAERLLDVYRAADGRSRGELEEELREMIGNDPAQLVHLGLAKLLEDRCEFEVVAGVAPETLREAVFSAAATARRAVGVSGPVPAMDTGQVPPANPGHLPLTFDRAAVLQDVAATFDLTPAAVQQGLFADLKSEQRLVRFKDINVERLLLRYNVALAQAVLLRSTRIQVTIRHEPPQRYRQLLRAVKFHRLVCELSRTGPETCELRLDGPLSLFSATQKYGLQLALFLPAVLLCKDFELRAELLWGPQRKPKTFFLTHEDGLVSHAGDTGMYVPVELTMFTELFRKKIAAWEIREETELLPLGDGFWVPDFSLVHRATGEVVYLEVLGFWRRASAERHLERLRKYAERPFLLAVSDQLHVEDAALDGLPAGIHRFRQMPLPDEVVRLAEDLLSGKQQHSE